MSRQGTWDIYAHSFMVGAILAILQGCRQNSRTGLYFVMAGMLLGLSFMSKGPVAFYAQLLPFGLSYVYGYGVEDFKNRWGWFLVATVICVVISAAWPLYLQWYEPDALAATATQEAMAWVSRRTRPFWHYWSFPVQSGLWTLLATAALIIPYAKKRIDPLGNYPFLVSWVLIAVFLISLVPQKKERYLMPVLVPMALLTGHYLRYLIMAFQQRYQSQSDVIIVHIHAIIVAIACVVAPFLIYIWIHPLSMSLLAIITIVLVIFAIALLRFTFHQQIAALLITTSLLLASVCGLILPVVARALPAHPDYKNIAHLKTIKEFQGLKYYALERPHIQTAWALGQRIETLPMRQGVLTRPRQLPALLLSKHRLSASSLPKKGFQVTFYDVYPHHRTKPVRKYFVYLLTPD
jgi:4-amino-4-deoxy-L-arabinose transferase-like glycosyltransferase